MLHCCINKINGLSRSPALWLPAAADLEVLCFSGMKSLIDRLLHQQRHVPQIRLLLLLQASSFANCHVNLVLPPAVLSPHSRQFCRGLTLCFGHLTWMKCGLICSNNKLRKFFCRGSTGSSSSSSSGDFASRTGHCSFIGGELLITLSHCLLPAVASTNVAFVHRSIGLSHKMQLTVIMPSHVGSVSVAAWSKSDPSSSVPAFSRSSASVRLFSGGLYWMERRRIAASKDRALSDCFAHCQLAW